MYVGPLIGQVLNPLLSFWMSTKLNLGFISEERSLRISPFFTRSQQNIFFLMKLLPVTSSFFFFVVLCQFVCLLESHVFIRSLCVWWTSVASCDSPPGVATTGRPYI